MPNPETTTTRPRLGDFRQCRFARQYSDGSFNVSRGGDDEATSIQRLSGSAEDDDTQLVEVPAALDAIVDVVLAYRPKPVSKPAKKRKRRTTKISKATRPEA